MQISNILVKSCSIDSNIASNIAKIIITNTVDKRQIIDWSRGVYLLFAKENGVAGEDDAERDAAAGGIKSSISGEGRARSS